MRKNIVAIGAQIARDKIEELPAEADVKVRILTGMKEVANFWLTTNETERFGSAIAGFLTASTTTKEEIKKVEEELEFLNNLNKGKFEVPENFKPIGLTVLWDEAKGK